MIRKMLTAGAAAAALFASGAQAAVVYTWQQVAGSPTISASAGNITFTDGSLPGAITYEYNGTGGGSGQVDPAAPFKTFSFGAQINGIAGPGSVSLFADSSIAHSGQRFILTDVQSVGNGLVGRFFALDSGNDAELTLVSDQTGLWTITSANDGQVGIGSGATGRWVLASSDVPEPGMLPLVALGAFGAAASLRRKRKA